MIKIYDGTQKCHTKPSLCLTCRDGQVIKGARDREEFQWCHAHGTTKRITWKVMDCSEYDNKSQPGLWQLEKIAWRFCKDDKRKTTGFLDAKQFKEKFPDED